MLNMDDTQIEISSILKSTVSREKSNSSHITKVTVILI